MSYFTVFLYWNNFEIHSVSILNDKRTVYFSNTSSLPYMTSLNMTISKWGGNSLVKKNQYKEITCIDPFYSNNYSIKEQIFLFILDEENRVPKSYIICPKTLFLIARKEKLRTKCIVSEKINI